MPTRRSGQLSAMTTLMLGVLGIGAAIKPFLLAPSRGRLIARELLCFRGGLGPQSQTFPTSKNPPTCSLGAFAGPLPAAQIPARGRGRQRRHPRCLPGICSWIRGESKGPLPADEEHNFVMSMTSPTRPPSTGPAAEFEMALRIRMDGHNDRVAVVHPCTSTACPSSAAPRSWSWPSRSPPGCWHRCIYPEWTQGRRSRRQSCGTR